MRENGGKPYRRFARQRARRGKHGDKKRLLGDAADGNTYRTNVARSVHKLRISYLSLLLARVLNCLQSYRNPQHAACEIPYLSKYVSYFCKYGSLLIARFRYLTLPVMWIGKQASSGFARVRIERTAVASMRARRVLSTFVVRTR